jgi:hypothetical protein
MNELVDTKKCVYSQLVHFNILQTQEFLQFIDHEGLHTNSLQIIKDEH